MWLDIFHNLRNICRGLDNAGKTTIVKKFNNEDVNSISPTLGFSIFTFDFQGHQLNIWDIGGQKSLRTYWRNYFEETDGIIWVVDSADRGRLKDCKHELDTLLKEEKLAGATLLIFANKQDIEGALSKEEICKILDLDAIENRHYRIVSCSAMTGEGLIEGISWQIDDIASRIFMLD